MKKVFFMLMAFCALIATNTVKAQTMKVGVFDIDQMVTAMPGYRAVDSMVQIYSRDSLDAEYAFYNSEYKRLDSTYKIDSAANKAKSVLSLEQQQKNQVAFNIIYWQQISQQKLQQKTAQLAQPLTNQVVNAYKKVLAEKKYTLVLRPDAIESNGTDFKTVDNIFVLVAKELKLPVDQFGGGQDQQQNNQQQQQPSKPSTTRPSTAKPPGK